MIVGANNIYKVSFKVNLIISWGYLDEKADIYGNRSGGFVHVGSALALYIVYDARMEILEIVWMCFFILVLKPVDLRILDICTLFSFVISPLDPTSKQTREHEKPFPSMSDTNDEYFSVSDFEQRWYLFQTGL